ncbi:MAG: hypothetical protein K8R40_03130 [Anaerolineaceae bacterium]|nr:hypothetical protein [Anaerolineaceae bacterium]
MEPFIALSYPESLEIWNTDTQTTLVKGKIGGINPPPSIWSTNGERIAVSVPMNTSVFHENVAEIYDSHTLNQVLTVKKGFGMNDTNVFSWNYKIDNPLMVLASRGDSYLLKDEVIEPYGFGQYITSGTMASFWIQDEMFLLINNETQNYDDETDERNVRIGLYNGLEMVTEFVVSPPPINMEKIILSADYDPDRRLLATYTCDGKLTLYIIAEDHIAFVTEADVPIVEGHVRIKISPINDGIYVYDTKNIIFANFVE